jgi:hypothetical protein
MYRSLDTEKYPTLSLAYVCYKTDIRKRKFVKELRKVGIHSELLDKIEYAECAGCNVELSEKESTFLYELAKKLKKQKELA